VRREGSRARNTAAKRPIIDTMSIREGFCAGKGLHWSGYGEGPTFETGFHCGFALITPLGTRRFFLETRRCY